MSFISSFLSGRRSTKAGHSHEELVGLVAAISRSQAVIEFDLEGKVVDANDNFLKALGYQIGEIKGQHHSLFVDPSYRTSVEYRLFWERLARGEFDSGQYKRIGKGGREVWIQASYNPILDRNGKPFKVVKYATDITAEKLKSADHDGQLKAVSKAQAVIEFTLDGKVLDANENFLKTLGYGLDEIKGQHHSLFVDAQYRASPEYRLFWERLARGEFDAGQYKRIGKGGREVWIQASYNPILDMNGKPFKVVKYATDITAEKLRSADYEGQLKAVSKAQAVIEFTMEGKVLDANENFLKALGYRLDEIKGQHHSMFVDAQYRASPEYRSFWERLARGEFDAGQYKRIGKGGSEIWIQASYNPILDMNGRPFKVVKYATDISEQVRFSEAMKQTVAEASGIAGAASAGDLTKRISLTGKSGALSELSVGVNDLLDAMSGLVGNVKAAADEVSRGADEISQGNTNLSQRTEEQASSLEETASAMEEMTSTVKQNAENAGQANQLALAAREQAEKGGSVVAMAVKAMGEIHDSSKQISDIIGVIDEIAFQTNLLALNAAVEAARAGEQGRGFAVVASEVRNLAGRSATAAKEIKALIQDSVRKVDEGSSLVTQSGATLGQIVGAVKKVTDIVAEISAASQEQSVGIEQVNKAVMQLDELTQQNAALVEEASAASQSMAEQARGLKESMQGYQVNQEAAARERPAAVPARPVTAQRTASAQGAERRSARRPWTGKKVAVPARAAESAQGEAVWKEF
jgi:methyl-accepting chemotaxis protein